MTVCAVKLRIYPDISVPPLRPRAVPEASAVPIWLGDLLDSACSNLNIEFNAAPVGVDAESEVERVLLELGRIASADDYVSLPLTLINAYPEWKHVVLRVPCLWKYVDISGSGYNIFDSLRLYCQNARDLHVINVKVGPLSAAAFIQDILRLVVSGDICTPLEYYTLDSLYVDSGHSLINLAMEGCIFPSVKTLVIHHVDFLFLFNIIASCPNIHELSIAFDKEVDVEGMQLICSNIEYLSILSYDNFDPTALLVKCGNLTSLRVFSICIGKRTMFMEGYSDAFLTTWYAFHNIFNSNPNFEKLTLVGIVFPSSPQLILETFKDLTNVTSLHWDDADFRALTIILMKYKPNKFFPRLCFLWLEHPRWSSWDAIINVIAARINIERQEKIGFSTISELRICLLNPDRLKSIVSVVSFCFISGLIGN
ncbi:hypothetical protein M422DRAFT_261596 [Sphaerobolus stellatus SS14]|uniref:F-box domain-containing protein n=1 Tax=Sphaerobolus stellatus (strain SS14) TaxID=990650 RepID=A0A0C9U038_SPHS4|nr:hypothetical protein M422DRAFT_261596 [Sphaerobolus stellatus SS14]